MMRIGVWGMALAAAGLLIAALEGPLSLVGVAPTWVLSDTDPAIEMPTRSILELLGFIFVLVGVFLLFRRVRGTVGMLQRPVFAGLFLLAAGAALRVLFYLLTFANAEVLASDATVLDEWNRAWYSGGVAAAAGVVFLTASMAPPRTRAILAVLAGVAAVMYTAIVFLEWDVAGLRDISLAVLGLSLVEVTLQVARDPVNRFH